MSVPTGQCPLKKLGDRSYHCTFELTLQIIGGKWKPMILYHLGCDGVHRFSELRRALNGITQKMLTQQLRELEADGMVHREVYPQVPPKVEYSLTPMGRTIMPVLRQLCAWGSEYERLAAQQEQAHLQAS
ncbi:transcriptional regulator, HxlR family [Paucidesulfovibrio gracilis DSM 16080]|uniref:Transcriptional regulator, HxlR family n=1 Tax=Paucidesulfovibrio gracilis DSM 16080 TaxID=1121449 RepID=A0A1T4XT29_9BACT|nr:helix-turn-helix domain-containing protein [Paucidesulfovibrio gracilis]SKA92201.1 transcriptional regulator, HxlR family [Paucidesulfovibrio gracilis DSM 16080]